MTDKKLSIYHITTTEHQDGCCYDCDPNFGRPYSDTKYVSDVEYAQLMDNEWERESITHVRKLTDNEVDAYLAGMSKQSGISYAEFDKNREETKEFLKTVVDALGWAVREAGGQIPWEINYNFEIGINEEFFGTNKWFKSFGYIEEYQLVKLFRDGSGKSYAPNKPKLADWELELLNNANEKEQGDIND
jgi:hypothetical protein